MVQYKVIEMIWLNYFSLEDKVHRLIRKYPVVGRQSSAPFLNSDTYFFLCTIRIERKDDIPLLRNRGENSSVYVDGNFLRAHEEEFLNAVNASNYEIPVLFIGDTDLPPSSRVLYSLQNSCKKIAAVNSDEESEKVRAVPLGLESQRYRSAGQLRDFWNQPDLRAKNRKIGILVAWNDNTNLIARQSARFTLRKSPQTFEIKARVTARYVHRLMRKSLFVACPPGNGLDTHRFWEALYLGAIPIVLKDAQSLSYQPWPKLVVDSWQDITVCSKDDLISAYTMQQDKLGQFRIDAGIFLQTFFER